MTRRERVRQETVADIKRRALAAIEQEGASALSVRAVARQMGMAASAIYRYYPSREAILSALIVDAFNDLGEAVESAIAAADPGDPFEAWMAAARATRRWGIAEPSRWGLIYGTPIPGYEAEVDLVQEPGMRITFALTGILVSGTRLGRVDRRALREAEAAMDPELLARIGDMVVGQQIPVPAPLMVQGVAVWSELIGIVSFEIFGHLRMLLPDASSLFEMQADRLGRTLAFTRSRPGIRARTDR